MAEAGVTRERVTRARETGARPARLSRARLGRARLGRAALWLVAGGLLALGQAPFGLWPVSLIVLIWLFATGLGPQRLWPAFRQGWVFGFGYFLVALHWIVEPFLVDLARHGWMAPFALVLMTGGLGLFWGAAFALARWITPQGPARGALVLTLALAEYLRSFVFTGFPWALIGHVWIDTGLAQAAALVGAHGLTLLTLGTTALAGGAIAFRRWALLPLPILALAALWTALAPGALGAPDSPPEAPVIRLVQPNIPQQEKWSWETLPGHMTRTLDLSRGVAEAPVPALVVWPETAIPWFLDDAGDLLESAADATRGAPLAIGVQRLEGERFYNSLALIDGQGQVIGTYDKGHLVPFGEYVPFGEFAARFGIRGLAASEGGGFSAGTDSRGRLVSVPGIGAALPLICYEGIFPGIVNSAEDRPRFLLLVTNDAWFGNLSGPYQHLAQGRLRAIEQGLPMVRVANTGVSALIDGRGRILGQIPLNTAGSLDLALPEALPTTPYARLGDWPVLVLLFLLASVVIWRRKSGAY